MPSRRYSGGLFYAWIVVSYVRENLGKAFLGSNMLIILLGLGSVLRFEWQTGGDTKSCMPLYGVT